VAIKTSLQANKLFRSAMVLAVGRSAGYALSFLRNLILARMLAKADYGLAAVFAMAVSLLEFSGGMAFGVQIVQSEEGDTPRFLACAHALQFAGGLLSALLIAAASMPMAGFFGVPHIWRSFALLAVVPLFQGFGHLDVARRQRELEYLPLMLVDVVPQFLITASIWPLIIWLKDYRVILCLMIGKAIFSAIMTFGLSKRPYRWAWDRDYMRSMLMFGWPLLVTGFVTFASQQADQMIVGAKFSLNLLANYALAFSLVSIPWFIYSQVAGSLILPILSGAKNDPGRFSSQYRICIQTAALFGVICILPLITSGEQLITYIFGAKYKGTGVFVAVLGAAFAVRFLRFVSGYAAVARADTLNQLYSYLWRGTSLPLAMLVIALRGTPLQIAGCSLVAEILTVLYSVIRLRRKQGVSLHESSRASIYLMALTALGTIFAIMFGADMSVWASATAGMGILTIAIIAAWFMFPEVVLFSFHAINGNAKRSETIPDLLK
jgi:O-antigen/teichoic acid export membrane protein